MSRIIRFALAAVVVLGVPSIARPQTGADRFQQALKKERVDGDLKGAIALYQQILKEQVADRSLSAKVLLQLASAYEKQGNADAKAAYQRIVRDYADQTEAASVARVRLVALSPAAVATGGTAVRRIWAGADVDPEGGPTRDGRLLTFVDWKTGDLAVHDLVTGEERHLTNKGPWTSSPEFALFSMPSRDGRQVAYVWFNTNAEAELRIVGIDGGPARMILTSPEIDYAQPCDWSPDGKTVLTILAKKDHTNQIALVSTANGAIRVLKTLDWRGPGKMTFSPDGKYVAYDTPPNDSTQKRDVFVLASDGSSENTLVKHSADDQVMGWSPDGRYVLISSDRTGGMSLWLIPVANGKATGEPVLARRDAELSIASMGITNDGGFMYVAGRSFADIYVATLDPVTGKSRGQPTRLVDNFVGSNQFAAWSPDGSEVVYVRQLGSLNKSRVLVIRSVATGVEHLVPAKLSYIGVPEWSPDGQIVVRANDLKGRQGIFMVHRQTGDVTMLAEGGSTQLGGWSADGKSFLYLTKDIPNRTSAIVKHDVATGEAKDLVRLPASNRSGIGLAQASPNGELVAFWVRTDSAASVLSVVAMNGGDSREVFRSPPGYEIRTLTWSADGRYILFAQHPIRSTATPAKVSVQRVPVGGGPAEETGIAMEDIVNLRAHPDGKRISFGGGAGRNTEIWMMENFFPKAEKPAKPRSH